MTGQGAQECSRGSEGRRSKLSLAKPNNHKLGLLAKQLFYVPRVYFVIRVEMLLTLEV